MKGTVKYHPDFFLVTVLIYKTRKILRTEKNSNKIKKIIEITADSKIA